MVLTDQPTAPCLDRSELTGAQQVVDEFSGDAQQFGGLSLPRSNGCSALGRLVRGCSSVMPANRPEGLSESFCQEPGFGDGWEVAAAVMFGPVDDVEVALGQFPWGLRNGTNMPRIPTPTEAQPLTRTAMARGLVVPRRRG